jgi:hypothetical protein
MILYTGKSDSYHAVGPTKPLLTRHCSPCKRPGTVLAFKDFYLYLRDQTHMGTGRNVTYTELEIFFTRHRLRAMRPMQPSSSWHSTFGRSPISSLKHVQVVHLPASLFHSSSNVESSQVTSLPSNLQRPRRSVPSATTGHTSPTVDTRRSSSVFSHLTLNSNVECTQNTVDAKGKEIAVCTDHEVTRLQMPVADAM